MKRLAAPATWWQCSAPHGVTRSTPQGTAGRPAATDTIGLDLHKRESQLCVLTTGGELVERRIATTRARFTEVLGGRPRARILLEASTRASGSRATSSR